MDNSANYEVFRECLSNSIVEKSEPKPSKTAKKRHKSKLPPKPSSPEPDTNYPPRTNPEELAEFTDFLASETFSSLPLPLQSLSYSSIQHNPALSTTYTVPLPAATVESITFPVPPTVIDTLSTYALIPDPANPDLPEFLSSVLNEYISAVTAPPPVWASTRPEACEICERDWIPLSYHHLIPRGVHAKVIKKGWHPEWMLNSVAWLCRACHSFVHRMAGNEELAREWFTIERIWEREDVRVWANWVGRVRWKAR